MNPAIKFLKNAFNLESSIYLMALLLAVLWILFEITK